MGLLDRIIGNAISDVTWSASNAIGNAIGHAANQVANEAVDGVVTEMKINKAKKQMAFDNEKKANELPPICPHCGAATAGKLVCDYCDCKIVE